MASEALLSEETKRAIDVWVAKFPPKRQRSAIVPTLRLVQAQNGGWLSEQLLEAIAAYLDLPKIEVFEVASFYDMLELAPIGNHKIGLCTNVSCMLRGAEGIKQHLETKLGAKFGETTADGEFTLRELECLGACNGAPVCQINNKKYYENLSNKRIDELLAELRKGDNDGA